MPFVIAISCPKNIVHWINAGRLLIAWLSGLARLLTFGVALCCRLGRIGVYPLFSPFYLFRCRFRQLIFQIFGSKNSPGLFEPKNSTSWNSVSVARLTVSLLFFRCRVSGSVRLYFHYFLSRRLSNFIFFDVVAGCLLYYFGPSKIYMELRVSISHHQSRNQIWDGSLSSIINRVVI